jgi:hypothetical protein
MPFYLSIELGEVFFARLDCTEITVIGTIGVFRGSGQSRKSGAAQRPDLLSRQRRTGTALRPAAGASPPPGH